MKWFKHDSDASSDAKIRKLIMRHGAVGYAVYFHCLELIAGNVSNDNITFELEHDSEIIADNLRVVGTGDKSGMEVVEAIMRTIIDLDLFENNDGRITCFKMIKRLDSSMTGNPSFRRLIAEAKESHDYQGESHDYLPDSHDSVMTESCLSHDTVMLEENRLDKKRLYNPPTPLEGEAPKKGRKKSSFVTAEQGASLLEQLLPEGNFRTIMADFISHRREIGKPMTERALTMLVSQLQRDLDTDSERVACVELSIANGWQGVFPEKMVHKPMGTTKVRNPRIDDKFSDSTGGDITHLL